MAERDDAAQQMVDDFAARGEAGAKVETPELDGAVKDLEAAVAREDGLRTVYQESGTYTREDGAVIEESFELKLNADGEKYLSNDAPAVEEKSGWAAALEGLGDIINDIKAGLGGASEGQEVSAEAKVALASPAQEASAEERGR